MGLSVAPNLLASFLSQLFCAKSCAREPSKLPSVLPPLIVRVPCGSWQAACSAPQKSPETRGLRRSMIAGSSSRKLPRDFGRSLQPAWEQLHLPWLCPRIHQRVQSPVRPHAQRRATATVSSRRPAAPSRTQTSPVATRHNPRQERGYAYAASADHYGPRSDDFYIPLVTETALPGQAWSHQPPGASPHSLTPLIIDDSTLLPLEGRTTRSNIRSNFNPVEMQRHLEACLIVGLHERAAATMRRLNGFFNADNPELLRAHNFFIGHMIGQYNTSSDETLFHFIQKWYHVDMINQGVQPDAATYTMMAQLMLRDADRNRAARGVRKYFAAADAAGLRDSVVAELQSVLDVGELTQINEMVPGLIGDLEADREVDVRPQELVEGEVAEEAKPELVWRGAIPKIVAVEQRGEGLKSLRKALSTLTPSSGEQQDAEAKRLRDNKYRQHKLETDAEKAAIERWRIESELADERGVMSGALTSNTTSIWTWEWHTSLLPLLREEIERFQVASDAGVPLQVDQAAYAPYLRFTSPERLSALAIVGTLNSLAAKTSDAHEPTTLVRVVSDVGSLVEKECAKEWSNMRRKNVFARNAARKQKNSETTHVEKPESLSRVAGTQHEKIRVQNTIMSLSPEAPEWSAATRIRVGAALLNLLLRVARLPATKDLPSRPAFQRWTAISKGRKVNCLRCDPVLHKQLKEEPSPANITKYLPMLTPPKPWTAYRSGAYLNDGVKAVRISNVSFQNARYVELAIQNGDMQRALDGLQILGEVPWQVNHEVLAVMTEAWNTGEPIANLAPLDPVVPFPEPPSPEASLAQKITYSRAKKAAEDKIRGLHSERCSQNFTLEVARSYLDETFYMPHNFDFRGRAYPIPPYLNHMGADHCRGLLLFAKGKELGEKGLEWLKIHLANVYGYDKASLSERRTFAEEHIADIYDSANNGLKGNKWWLKAEDPWQCLATCIEIRNALQSPDPTKFVSHLPVHQDGTCNGLQHYAALGGDEAGAKQVNLEPGDRPSDIYTAVADLVREYVTKDATDGLHLAKLLQDKIVRKVVKQTVMTNVYGVTFQGAQQQVEARLDELYPETFEQDLYLRFLASHYLAKMIFKALGSIFNGASAIQQWLGDCAGRICDSVTPEQIALVENLVDTENSLDSVPLKRAKGNTSRLAPLEEHTGFKSSVIWTTPLGLPVVQPYRATSTQIVRTNLASIIVVAPTVSDQVAKRKQLQAFPPNFIHSLDATHMLLTAFKCHELGMSFAAVHDSFWTHAADIDTMSTAIRDTFVRMHSDDVMGRLSSEFHARYKDNMYLAAVSKRSPLGKKVAAMRKDKGYLAKHEKRNKIAELVEEHRRQTLLKSEDPKLRRQGEAMMTAARLYEETKHDTELMPPDDLTPETLVNNGSDSKAVTTEDLEAVESEIVAESASIGTAAAVVAERLSDAKPGADSPVTQSGFAGASKEVQKLAQQLRSRAPAKKHKARDSKIWIWLPLAFPPLPQKGGWDVSRLKKSKYFFS